MAKPVAHLDNSVLGNAPSDVASSLFDRTSDFYRSAQSAINSALDGVLERHVETNSASPMVCTPGIDVPVLMKRFKTDGQIPEDGLLPLDFASRPQSAEAGEAAGARLAETYLAQLEQDVVCDEMKLQSGNMIGHMAGSLPPWVSPMSRLVTSLHCNVVKAETGKTSTFLERETMAKMHRAFFNCSDSFYAQHAMDVNGSLGHPCQGGTTANLEAMWVARNKVLPHRSPTDPRLKPRHATPPHATPRHPNPNPTQT